MAESYTRRSPLQHFGLTAAAAKSNAAGAEVLIGDSAHRAIVNIRGDGGEAFKPVNRGHGEELGGRNEMGYDTTAPASGWAPGAGARHAASGHACAGA